MDVLLAAMAFAVMMIVFSTLVTGITEAYLRLTANRPKVLASAVLQFLKTDPTLEHYRKGINLEAVRDALTLNTAIPDNAATDEAARSSGFKRVDRLSTYSFLQRLAGTNLGRALAERADDYALQAVSMGFERYVAASNEVFRKQAQAVTFGIAIALAFALNIDGSRLFQHFVNNPESSQALVDEVERIREQNEEELAELQVALDKLSAGELTAASTDATAVIDQAKDSVNDLTGILGSVEIQDSHLA